MLIDGDGPTIAGITAHYFSIVFDIGTNPFLLPGSTASLFELVLNSSVDRFRVGAESNPTTHSGDLQTNVSGSISAVPVPASVWLFGTALIGFVGMSRRRRVA